MHHPKLTLTCVVALTRWWALTCILYFTWIHTLTITWIVAFNSILTCNLNLTFKFTYTDFDLDLYYHLHPNLNNDDNLELELYLDFMSLHWSYWQWPLTPYWHRLRLLQLPWPQRWKNYFLSWNAASTQKSLSDYMSQQFLTGFIAFVQES